VTRVAVGLSSDLGNTPKCTQHLTICELTANYCRL